MELNTYFTDFFSNIRLPDEYAEECRKAHESLRERLEGDPKLGPIIVSIFLQGSYRRGTAIRPDHEQRADVDVVLVSKLNKEEYTPDKVFPEFIPFLEKYYKGRYKFQGRSIGINLEHIDLDLVVAAAPSESEWGILQSASVAGNYTLEEEKDWMLRQDWVPISKRPPEVANSEKSPPNNGEWKSEPLYIPDREVKVWEPTHPLAQIQWTRDKNKRCNGHYINVVKAFKWWYRNHKGISKYPKGYLIEHLVGTFCPDGIQSVAEGIARTMEAITIACKDDAMGYRVPHFPDHGVPEHNVFKRISRLEFAQFYNKVAESSKFARQALDSEDVSQSAANWIKLFGEDFPEAPPNDGKGGGPDKGGFTPRTGPSVIGGGRFA